MTTPEQWSRIKQIVGDALEMDAARRDAYVREACGPDAELRAEVDSLIRAHGDSDGLSVAFEEEAEREPESLTRTPEVIGRYRLVRLLGTGGMGQVWLAEQTEPVQRAVALKLNRPGFFDAEALRRFQGERQSLAVMNHPTIAKVLDADMTAAGQPYLVMEYVEGLPITAYCDSRKLGLKERLRLFIQVCEGIQHAHAKAILHRDLKPSNILVVEVDGKPVPKIIDFGLAKTMGPMDAELMLTQVGMVLGTPGYMSPEQADPAVEDIDTRTDIYSLGVILYELLTGHPAFDLAVLRKQRMDEMLRRLREVDPPAPSTRVEGDAKTIVRMAEARGMDGAHLVSALRGDLDWITMKALERERERRYATASEFAADIGRYLQNLPVEARPASAMYRMQKYVRRNRIAVAVAGAAALLLVVFAVVQAVQLRRITRERDRADRIADFMTDMFKVSDPSVARGNTVTAKEILDKSSREIEGRLGQDAAVQTQLMEVMARTYASLGLYDRARDLAERVLRRRQQTQGEDDPAVLSLKGQLAWYMFQQGHTAEGEAMMHRVIDADTKLLGLDDARTMEAEERMVHMLNLGAHYEEAERLAQQVLAASSRKFGPESARALNAQRTLAGALQGQSKFAEAEKVYKQVMEVERRTVPEGDPTRLATMHNYGNMLQEQGRMKEAEAMQRLTLATEQKVLGVNHPETVDTMMTLANVIRSDHARTAESEQMYRQALEISLRAVGPDHMYTTRAEEGLANQLSTEHRYGEAEELLRKVLATRQRTLGPENTDTLLTQYNVASVLVHEERLGDAEALLRDTIARQSRSLDVNDPDTMASKALLAKTLTKEGKLAEAVEVAREAYTQQAKVLGPTHGDTLDGLSILATALERSHRGEEARQVYLSAIRGIEAKPGGDASNVWYDLACDESRAGRTEEALDALEHAIKKEAGAGQGAGTAVTDAEAMRSEPDLKPLQGNKRFQQMLRQLKGQAKPA